MISDPDDRHARCAQRSVDTTREGQSTNEKKNNNDIGNRRHSIAHINFRRAIYRSLSLPQANDESNNILTRYMKYFIKLFFICLFIILIGSLIKLMWPFNRHK